MTATPDEYVAYARRGYGMDHEWYRWAPPQTRPPIRWPQGQPVAVLVVVPLQWFPLDMAAGPVRVPGGLERPYPDVGMYSLRDYGNRVGSHRVFDVLTDLGLQASVAVNAAVAERYPILVQEVQQQGWEVLAHGVDMGTPHHAGIPLEVERQQVRTALETLNSHVDGPVTGWMSPGRSQSMQTLTLLVEARLDYVCDWPNDERPYRMQTPAGPLTSLPVSNELDDHTIMVELRHSETSFAEQVIDQLRRLQREATPDDGRLLTLTVHPWISGQPHRIAALRTALQTIAAAGVWSATGAQIVQICQPMLPPPDEEERPWTSD
ncbi:MAG: polysaccharide deacetylase family protein [Chloroflexi bacterium]|nr:polysaccharide deacetylase family protein [Chloroflexota bacterium]